MRKYRIAVIGCGAVAKNHGKALLTSEYAQLVCCVDIDRQKAEQFAAAYGGEVMTDYRELAGRSDIDAVHVITPHNTHPDIVIDCLGYGKHVFCEKPLAVHVSDGKRMIDAWKKTDRQLGICFQNRMNDSTLRARQLLADKTYGNILSAAALVRWDRGGKYYSESPWRGTYEGEGGGTIINQSIHTIDLLQYLTGGVTSLSAVDAHLRDSTDYEVEDSCMVNFNLACGGTAVGYFTNCARGFKTADLEIVCERARLVISQKGLMVCTDNESCFYESETAVGEKSEWGLSHGKMIEEFYRAVDAGTPFFCGPEEALESVKIIAAMQHSKGRTINV